MMTKKYNIKSEIIAMILKNIKELFIKLKI